VPPRIGIGYESVGHKTPIMPSGTSCAPGVSSTPATTRSSSARSASQGVHGLALGHAAVRRRCKVSIQRTDVVLQRLRASRLDNGHDAELRKLIRVDLAGPSWARVREPRVMALLASLASFEHVTAGLTNAGLRCHMVDLYDPAYGAHQATYDLRRLRLKG
jgi:hypothetical protein